MKIEVLTKQDFETIEAKLNQLIQLLQSDSSSGVDTIYTTRQLAKKLSVSTKTIQNWRQEKLIQFSQVNSKIFYTQKSVEDFLAKHSIKRRNTATLLTPSNKML